MKHELALWIWGIVERMNEKQVINFEHKARKAHYTRTQMENMKGLFSKIPKEYNTAHSCLVKKIQDLEKKQKWYALQAGNAQIRLLEAKDWIRLIKARMEASYGMETSGSQAAQGSEER